MMRLSACLIVVATWSFAAPAAKGAEVSLFTANDLLIRCKAAQAVDAGDLREENLQRGIFCLAYVKGAMDYMAILNTASTLKFCIPTGVTAAQVGRIFSKHAEANPELLHDKASMVLAHAVMQAFPCPN